MGNGGIVPSPRQLFFLVKIDDFGYCNFFAMPLFLQYLDYRIFVNNHDQGFFSSAEH